MTATNRNTTPFDRLKGTEILSERGEFRKVYDLGRGRRQAILFAAPVHFQDENGAWQEIDNTLETAEEADGRSVLRNRGNAMRMEFDRHRGAVRIAHQGHALSWRLLNGAETAPVVATGTELRQKRQERTGMRTALDTPQDKRMNRGHKMNAQVEYPNARPGLSLRYSVTGVRMKEDIILENAEAAADTAILLPADYTYTVGKDMRVHVMDGEAERFTFEAPCTADAAGHETVASVSIEQAEGGVILRYALDEKFLSEAVYPVTIDPVVTTPTTNTTVKDAYIYEKYPDRNFGDVHLMRSGTLEGNYSISMLRFENLIKLKASDTVVSAQLRLCEQNKGSTTEYMGCFPIKQAWDDTVVTWNSVGGANLTDNAYISDDLLAYVTGTSGARYFDLTPVYRDWYKADAQGNTANYGVAIHCPAGVNDTSAYVEWAASKYDADTAPCMIVNYVSHAGRQGWWQYESMNASRAGSAYVDLFNGNLVYEHGDGSTTGSRMPVGLTHIYNSCLSESNPVGCGMGWRTSMHQSVNKRALSDENYYVWTDGGATEHFFLISGSQPYEDCEGMGLKLNISGSNLTITDKQHNVMTFPKPADTTQQSLTQIADALGNTATLTYDADGLLTQITDGVGRVTTLSYTDGLLSALSIPGCPALTFSYSGENLTGISYADVTSGGTVFTYESGSNLLTAAQNFDGIKLNIGYEAAGYYCADAVENYAQQVRRVISLNRSVGTSVGGGMEIEYLHMTTKVTAVTSGIANENKTLTYLFNSAGNPVCVYDELGYAQSNTYSDTVSNQLSSSSRLHKVTINKLSNIDFSTGWTASGSTATQDSSTRCLGMPSLKFTKTAAAEASYSLPVTVSETGTYTFSAYVKNDAALTSGELFVRIRTGSNSYKSRAVTEATASLNTDSAAEGWDRIYVTATLPVGTAYVDLVDAAPSGNAWFACPQLEEGAVPNHVNLLLNGDFTRTYTDSTTAQTFASDWNPSAGISTNALNGVVSHASADLPTGLSGNAMRIHSYCNTDRNSHCQILPVSGAKGDVFVIGGWVNANSVYSGDTNTFKPAIISRFKDTSGSWGDWQYNEYDVQRVGWKFAQWAIVAPKAYTGMQIGVQYARNHGTAMFADVFVYREEFGESFTYDDDKNVVSAAALSAQKSAMEYDDADNLKSYRQPGADDSAKYAMSYGSTAAERKKHLLLTSQTPMGVKNSYEYDSYGNPVKSVNQKTSGGSFIQATTAYTDDGNYVASTTDARGNVVTQNVNATDGTLTSVTDPNGQTVSYSYDAAKRVTAVQTVADSKAYRNAYAYENDRIKTVAHNTTTNTEDVTYTFGYDTLGRKTTVQVGTQNLSTNEYKSTRSDLLSSVSYGNGGKVAYSYDAFDRLVGVKHDGDASDRYSYEYGANGQAAIVRDSNLGRVLQTECDLAERPMGTQLRDANGNLLYRTVLDYDKQNRLVGFGEAAGNETYKTEYTYDNDNRVTAQSFDGTAAVSYAYDELGRVSSRTAGALTSAYSYVAGGHGTNSTTPLVASISQGSIPFTYAYDNRGNIISETRSGVTTTYSYDALGQLIRVNDPVQNQTWVFNYDRGGNITSRVRYAYTTGTVGTALETIPYVYGDSNWKDKLTSYNGKAITYDAIGNSLTFDGWTYSWQAGRQLAGMSKSGATLSFKYDHNGLRTQKVVQTNWLPETTNYFLHGKLITHMTVDYSDLNETAHTDVLHFFYDAQSRPAQVKFNDVIYTYIHNLQGDIVGILDSTGTLVVEYKYDAWGKPISTTGTLADTLGKRNPFRYRGYVYDEETGLYYLRSRYYNPEVGRFINADTVLGKVGGLGSHNQFSYCANAPIGLLDENGQSFGSNLKRFGEQFAYYLRYKRQIRFWNTVCLGLYAIGCKHSAELLNHSLQPKPSTISYSNDSPLAEKIKNDSEFKKEMATIINDQIFDVKHSMSFNSDFDLFGSLHNVSMIVSPVTINGTDMYHVSMSDTYDFKYESDYSSQSPSFWKRAMKAGAIVGNNLAYLDMNLGAINEYKILIDFYVE